MLHFNEDSFGFSHFFSFQGPSRIDCHRVALNFKMKVETSKAWSSLECMSFTFLNAADLKIWINKRIQMIKA